MRRRTLLLWGCGGVFSTAVYGSDLAGDVRACALPLWKAAAPGDEVADRIAAGFVGEDAAELWWVIAVTLHRAGIAARRARARALAGLADNLASWERDGATAPDHRARRRVLDGVREEATGLLPPRRARTVQAPERLTASVGDVWVFTPADFAPENFSYDKTIWTFERQVAGVTLAADHLLGALGVYVHAVVELPRGACTMQDVVVAPVLHAALGDAVGPVLSLTWATPWPRARMKRLGRLEIARSLAGWVDVDALTARPDRGRTMTDLAITPLWMDAVRDDRAVVADLIA